MQKAKQAVSNFISNDGKHKTTVHEDIRGAVTEEHVQPHRHENVTTAVDKEVHQDHHHTTVQPIKHKETLPEQHHHNIVPVEHKTIHHGDDQKLRDTLDRDAAQFKDTSVTHDTKHHVTTAPVVQGERIHHHVHEHVQPVIQKETIQPHVVHTTIPVHETHHAEAIHHGTSVLPTKTLDEFKGSGGVTEGRGLTKLDEYEGCPPTYNKDLQKEQLEGDKSLHAHSHHDHHNHGKEAAAAGHHAHNREGTEFGGNTGREGVLGDGHPSRHQEGTLGDTTRRHEGTEFGGNTGREGVLGDEARPHHEGTLGNIHRREGTEFGGNTGYEGVRGSGLGNTAGRENVPGSDLGSSTNAGTTGTRSMNTTKPHLGTNSSGTITGAPGSEAKTKPSIMDRLNPLKDADGDGKKGLMD
ncbi:Fc.00g113550.m01.CDS01 [Cosmosporella sp. VM-42]